MLWSDFQDTADRLAAGATEGDWRSAVSRSYYAAFHYFRTFMLTHGVDVGRGGQSHSSLSSGLMNCGLPLVDSFGRRLDRLRTDRTKADYDFSRPVGHVYAHGVVRDGRTLPVDFEALLLTLPAASIAAGVRRYLRSIGRIP